MKHYPELNLSMLSLEISSSSGDQIVLGQMREVKQRRPPPDFCYCSPLFFVKRMVKSLVKEIEMK